jgi:hypothetical protein
MSLTPYQERALDHLEPFAGEYEPESFLRDILSDLKHWADVKGIHFYDELNAAHANYMAECV